jgi:hypothetical protein
MEDQNNRSINQKKIIDELIAIAYADPANFTEPDGEGGTRFKSPSKWSEIEAKAVKGISFDNDSGEILGIELHSKEQALKMLSNISGLDHELNTAFSSLFKYGYNIEREDDETLIIRDKQTEEKDVYSILSKLERQGWEIQPEKNGEITLLPPESEII